MIFQLPETTTYVEKLYFEMKRTHIMMIRVELKHERSNQDDEGFYKI